jgi:hypothetical protein
MSEPGGGAGFAQEAGAGSGIVGGEQAFDRHPTFETGVPGFVDLAHAAASQKGVEAVGS